MGSLTGTLSKYLRLASTSPTSSVGLCRGAGLRPYSSSPEEPAEKNEIEGGDDFLDEKTELEPQGVDPKRGWGFRGVHKAILCGKVGQTPLQKLLRNGRTLTIFTVGTGGMYDQRISRSSNLPRLAQWHRIVVHNEALGAYAVQQVVKSSSVFIEGDIETRVCNDSINGQIKNIPEICVRRDDILIEGLMQFIISCKHWK